MTQSQFFADRFKTALKMWKEKAEEAGEKTRQKDFADRIFVSDNMIIKYKEGTYPRKETIACMIKEFQRVGLDITEEFFYPSSHIDKYLHDGTFVDRLIQDRIDYAEKIGMDLNFLHFIWNNIDTSQYPVWSPLREMLKADDPSSTAYRRQPLAKTNIECDFLQVKAGGGTFLLSDIDIHILKDIQRQVECYIEYLFFQRKRDMDNQVVEANKQSRTEEDNGWTGYHSLTKEELIAIDSYMKYLNWRE